MSEQIARKTLEGIYDFCSFSIEKKDVRNHCLKYINYTFENWSESWILIKQFLLGIEFQNKEQDLLNFIEIIPELQIFQNVMLGYIAYNSDFWDAVYNNLKNCKTLLTLE